MAQIKKPHARAAILNAAFRLFRRQTYDGTTLAQIASEAGMTSGNLYVYFASKLDLLYAVYEPWLRARITLLRAKVDGIDSPEERLRLILRTLWKELPAEENGLLNNFVQALSTAAPDERYKPSLLNWIEEELGTMVREALPVRRRAVIDETRLAHLMIMAADGYAIHEHINPPDVGDDATIDAVVDLLLGKPLRSRRPAGRRRASASSRRPSVRRRRSPKP